MRDLAQSNYSAHQEQITNNLEWIETKAVQRDKVSSRVGNNLPSKNLRVRCISKLYSTGRAQGHILLEMGRRKVSKIEEREMNTIYQNLTSEIII